LPVLINALVTLDDDEDPSKETTGEL